MQLAIKSEWVLLLHLLPGKQSTLYFCALFFFIRVFKKIYLFYLFLSALGLHCCAWPFISCGERGLLFVAVRGLLIAVPSLVAEHGL